MRIARLELHGFKSFPDRTVFQFGAGISCVVGPNGSGKSNVVDALKWCVGEQSARSLRGAEMVDVIFAGSTDRKPVGYAEVLLTLQATEDYPFPGEYAQLLEVQVGRRLHRTGASEYLLNQVKVRRRDVVDLLMDSGIGNNLYSFIEQGQVDKMITATPEERRTLIDEAAGIARYKARRDESQERMVQTAAQLDRAADVVDEMTRRLRVLEQQVVRAARFRSARARVRQHELHLALAKHHALGADRRGLRARLDELRGRQDSGRREAARREEDLAARRAEKEVSEQLLATRRDEVSELDGRIREQDATALLHERRAAELQLEATRATLERDRTEEQRQATLLEAAAVDAELAGLAGERAGHAGALAEAERLRDAREAALAEARRAVEVANEAVGAARAARAVADAAASTATRDREAAERRVSELVAARAKRDDAVLVAAREVDRLRRLGAELAKRVAEEEAAVDAAHAAHAAAVTDEEAALAALRDGEGARDRALAAQRAADHRLAEARERGNAWRRALEAAGTAELRAFDAAAAERRRRLAEEGARGVGEAVRALDLALRAEAAEEAGRREAAVAEATAATRQANAALEGALRALRAAEGELAKADGTANALEAERAAVERSLGTVEGDEALLRRVLGKPEPLLAALPPERRAEAAARLGDRAQWVVVRDAAKLEALRKAATSGLAVWWWPPGAPDPATRIAPAARPADVPAGEAGAGPGFLVDPLGAVFLGPTSRVAAAVARAEQLGAELAAAKEAGRVLRAEVAAKAEARRAAEKVLEEAQRAEKGARGAQRAFAEATDARRAGAVAEREGALRAELRERSRALEAAIVRDRAALDARAHRAVADADVARLADALREPPVPVPEPAALRAAAGAARARVGALAKALQEARNAHSAAEREHAVAATGQERAEAERARLLGELDADDRAVKAAQHAVVARRADEEAGAAAVARQVAAVAAAVAAIPSAAVSEAERERAAALEGVRAVERLLARVDSREAGARARKGGAEERARTLEASRDRSAELAREKAAAAQEARGAEAAARSAASAAREARGAAWDALERTRAHAAKLGDDLQVAERAARAQRAALEAAERELERVGIDIGAVQQELEVLRRSMEDRYQVSLPAALDRVLTGGFPLGVDVDAAEGVVVAGEAVEPVLSRTIVPADLADEDALRAAVEALDALRIELAAIGEVNLAAWGEYRELSERLGELSAQRADLEHALDQIRQAIARLNKECRERFRDTFDRVNEHFQETYPRLVGGGSARLSLTDDEDLLETGVDIFVQPPGKRLQSLTLLSGGEKAMTAIALLIALFRVKPSPFCVLDEVDAPLDEANGARFNDMLREMSQRSQFLVVTHNRKTMECADTLYGVTMARPGVSRLVSVNLGTDERMV